MATFLQLCERLTTRSGVIGTAPLSVASQAGRQGRCVDWIVAAWELIQSLHDDWSFLQGEWGGALSLEVPTYGAAELGIAERFGAWKGDRGRGARRYRPTTLHDPEIGLADETPLGEVDFALWRETYDRGAQVPGRPICYCFAPDGTIRFGPRPDKAYYAQGEYRKAPQRLASDNESPDLPEAFHDVIVYRAMMLADEDDEAPAPLGFTRARLRYAELLGAMQRACLPEIEVAGGR
jgi:hypothetical protein